MSSPASLHLHSPLSAVSGLSTPALKMLGAEKFETVGDLLLYYPLRHEDRRSTGFTALSPSEIPICHRVRIRSTKVLRFGGRGGSFEAVTVPVVDHPFRQELTLRWFGMPYLQKALAVDMELMVYGKIKDVKGRLIMAHPEYEVLQDDGEEGNNPHSDRIVPVYRLKGGLKQKPLRAAVARLVEVLHGKNVPDLLPPPKTGGEFSQMTRSRALTLMHCPTEMPELDLARRYLALEEFYLMQLRVLRRRKRFKHLGGWKQNPPGHLREEFLQSLPFSLTEAQQRSLQEVLRDMADSRPMNRLLHGDVGSGKTVVALAAMLTAVEAGQQAALMAPTQILAEQHFQKAREWLEPLGIRVILRTGGRDKDTGALPLFSVGKGDEPQVWIGTHALLYEREELTRLGLVVIDEQHKFGVEQRARLIARGVAPDVLVMTATPIPRTLTLTAYGDLDVSVLDERPRARGKVVTAVREEPQLKEVTKFVLEQLEAGRQCYVVYPLIEESEKLDAGAAVKGHGEWRKKLEHHEVELLHGRMDREEKESVMRRFRDGRAEVLVSTTVIEVGVDVPNATVMIIHDAARFGLAQLHQLRGRIGRGSHASYAILLVAKGDREAKEKLRIMEETTDGFRIAEEDLVRRGPGDVLGQAQSGQAPLRFGHMLADTRLLSLARLLAERTLVEDPELQQEKHGDLRAAVGEEPEDSVAAQ